MREFYRGALLHVKATFKDPMSVPPNQVFDPTTVNLTIEPPAPTPPTTETFGEAGSEIVKESVGVYTRNIDLNQTGIWHYRWWSTGVGQAAIRIPFEVVDVMVE